MRLLTEYENDELKNIDVFADFHNLAHFFESIGVLVRKGLIDISLVEDLMAGRVIWFYEKSEKWINFVRQRFQDPEQFDNVEYLYHELKRRQQATVSI